MKKILFRKSKQDYDSISDDLSELLWANIYHDTINGKNWLKNVSISPYDMAINYSMLYLLTRLFSDFNIVNILEFGLGQSSKFINAYLNDCENEILHEVIEHDIEWINFFICKLNSKSKIIKLNIISEKFQNQTIQTYDNLLNIIKPNYDLYLIDGPNGLPNYSRFDICKIAENFNKDDQFIIIMDDYQRPGEKETIEVLKSILSRKNIMYNFKIFKGNKAQFLLVTEKYKFAMTF